MTSMNNVKIDLSSNFVNDNVMLQKNLGVDEVHDCLFPLSEVFKLFSLELILRCGENS